LRSYFDKLTDAIKSKVIIDNSDIKLLNDKKDAENIAQQLRGVINQSKAK
jgi:hypothetical protein